MRRDGRHDERSPRRRRRRPYARFRSLCTETVTFSVRVEGQRPGTREIRGGRIDSRGSVYRHQNGGRVRTGTTADLAVCKNEHGRRRVTITIWFFFNFLSC